MMREHHMNTQVGNFNQHNSVAQSDAMPLLVTNGGPAFFPPQHQWDGMLRCRSWTPAAAGESDWKETRANPPLTATRRAAPAQSSLKWKETFGARGINEPDTERSSIHSQCGDGLFESANPIEWQKQGPGLDNCAAVPPLGSGGRDATVVRTTSSPPSSRRNKKVRGEALFSISVSKLCSSSVCIVCGCSVALAMCVRQVLSRLVVIILIKNGDFGWFHSAKLSFSCAPRWVVSYTPYSHNILHLSPKEWLEPKLISMWAMKLLSVKTRSAWDAMWN